jgi:hypothetical protein
MFFAPMLNCDCEVCKDAREAHDTAIPISPKFNSTDLLLLAHDEWKRRQERKHLNDETPWVSGFIGGFITDKTWARNMLDKLKEHP